MTPTVKVLAICLMALSLALPAAALGASTTRRAALTNVSVVGRECLTGANKGGAGEGQVKFSPDATTAGYMDLTIVIRRAIPDTQYNIYLDTTACAEFYGGTLTTDSGGNATVTVSVFLDGSAATSFWAYLYDDPTNLHSLATRAVSF